MGLSVNPDPAPAGGTATISYGPSSGSGQLTVTITPDGGGDPMYVSFDLDENGSGSGIWEVPSSWSGATLSAPGADSIYVTIESGMTMG
jgi:hypothetical protein